jgi:hypothetical protein
MTSGAHMDEFGPPAGDAGWTTGPKEETFRVGDFVKNYKKQAHKAATGKSKLAEAFAEVASKILTQFWGFLKQAVELALSKFLVELCAMIIAGISAALASRQGRHVDISTPGVFYNKSGAQAPTPQANNSTQGSLWDNSRSPFDSGWSRGSSPAW